MLGAVREATLAFSYQANLVIALEQRAVAFNHLKDSQRARADIELALSLARE